MKLNLRRDLTVRITVKVGAPQGDTPNLSPLVRRALSDVIEGHNHSVGRWVTILHPNGCVVRIGHSNWYAWRNWVSNVWDWATTVVKSL